MIQFKRTALPRKRPSREKAVGRVSLAYKGFRDFTSALIKYSVSRSWFEHCVWTIYAENRGGASSWSNAGEKDLHSAQGAKLASKCLHAFCSVILGILYSKFWLWGLACRGGCSRGDLAQCRLLRRLFWGKNQVLTLQTLLTCLVYSLVGKISSNWSSLLLNAMHAVLQLCYARLTHGVWNFLQSCLAKEHVWVILSTYIIRGYCLEQ